jgi:Cu-Zn family superoxide dismutase
MGNNTSHQVIKELVCVINSCNTTYQVKGVVILKHNRYPSSEIPRLLSVIPTSPAFTMNMATQHEISPDMPLISIEYNISGLKPNSLHGFHIHDSGDLRNGCESLCSHYNPHNNKHGDLHDVESHAGDLGNIRSDINGIAKGVLYTNKFGLEEVIGRSIIIHEDMDDLGRGPFDDSHITGHSGKRIGCGILGRGKMCK